MRTISRTGLAFVAASLAFGGLAAAPAGTTPAEQTFYLRQDGCGAEAGPARLSVVLGEDGADGCGIIGGLPLAEVLDQLDANEGTTFTSEDGMPVFIDATVDVAGQLRAESWFGDLVPGAGQVTFDVKLTAKVGGKNVTIGSTSLEAVGAGSSQTLEYSFDVDDALDGLEVTKMSLTVAQAGVNWNNTNLGLDGDSFFTFGIHAAA